MDADASPKAYRSKLKTLSNNKNQLVSHIYYKNTILQILKRRFISSTISKQCTLVDNTGKLMTNSFKRTNNLLSTILFTKDDFAKTTKNLNPNKAHGYDVISILMLKICGDSIWNVLELIQKSCIESGKFPTKWKKASIDTVHKK